MALALSFTVAESNDNKLITVTDTTGIYDAVTNTGGWGNPNPEVTDIDPIGTHFLELIITITTSNGVETTYDAINLETEFGPFTSVTDLVFTLDPSMLVTGGVELGIADSEFPDGIYNFEYVYDDGVDPGEVSVTADILIEGKVRAAIYELYRTIPVTYNCSDCKSKRILDIIFTKAYYDAMVISAYVAREAELLNMLAVIERLVTDGSSYSW